MVVSRKEILIDNLKKHYKPYYSLKDKEVTFYELPEMNYLVTNGVNTRNIYDMYDYKEIWTTGRFINRVKHYTIKELGKNFSRMPLEMQWGDQNGDKVNFQAMMAVPDYINEALYNSTVNDLRDRNGEMDFTINLTHFPKRKCAQILHVGSYATVDETKERLTTFVEKQGYRCIGKPVETYMNHPHCNPPDKLKILLRQEVSE